MNPRPMTQDEFEESIDLYLSGDLTGRRRAAFRAELFRDRDRYEAVRRARDCHGVIDDYFEHLRSKREPMAERVLGELLEDAPSRRVAGIPALDRRRLAWILGSIGVAAALLIAVVLVRTSLLEERVLARVARVEGQVALLDANGGSRSLERGGSVRGGEIFETDEGGLVALRFGDGTSARYRGEGRLELDARGDRTVLRPDGGELHVTGASPDGRVIVETDLGAIDITEGPADFVVQGPATRSGMDFAGGSGVIEQPETGDTRSPMRLEIERGEVELVRPGGDRTLAEVGTFEVDSDRLSRIDPVERMASPDAGGSVVIPREPVSSGPVSGDAASASGSGDRSAARPSSDEGGIVIGSAPIRSSRLESTVRGKLNGCFEDLTRLLEARTEEKGIETMLSIALRIEARRRAIVEQIVGTTDERVLDELLIDLTGDLAVGARPGLAGTLSDAIAVDLSTRFRQADETLLSRMEMELVPPKGMTPLSLSIAYVTVPDRRIDIKLWDALDRSRPVLPLLYTRLLVQHELDPKPEETAAKLLRLGAHDRTLALLPFFPGEASLGVLEKLSEKIDMDERVHDAIEEAIRENRGIPPRTLASLLYTNDEFVLHYLAAYRIRYPDAPLASDDYLDKKLMQGLEKRRRSGRLDWYRDLGRRAWVLGEGLTTRSKVDVSDLHPRAFAIATSGKARLGEFPPYDRVKDLSGWCKLFRKDVERPGRDELMPAERTALLVELLIAGAPAEWTDDIGQEHERLMLEQLRALDRLRLGVDEQVLSEALIPQLVTSRFGWRYRHWFALFFND